MKKSSGLLKITALFSGLLLLLPMGCQNAPGEASSAFAPPDSSSSEQANGMTKGMKLVQDNRENGVFPMFCNDFDYTRGGDIPENGEDYLNYGAYKAQSFTYGDMKSHPSALAAARLAQMGVFQQAEAFHPEGTITVLDCIRKIFLAAGQSLEGKNDDAVIALAESSGLVEKDVIPDFQKEITLPQLAYLADRATIDRENVQQFAMFFSDFDQVPPALQAGVLQAFGLGIIECKGTLSPDTPVQRCVAADVLYRLVNPGARVLTPYELGTLYNDADAEFLVRNTYVTNPGGVQLGVYSNYNRQDVTFDYFGKRAIDRTEFYKWAGIEKTKGKYSMPNFANDLAAHRAGNTAVINVDLSANYNVAPSLSDGSRIPSFYTQDITDKTTRTAAKQFLYQFVSSLMSAVYGDVVLCIDYELDFQQGLNGTTQQFRDRAANFAQWYVEACGVAREAARSAGALDRLKLICIYNNISDLHKLGKGQNEWMLKIAEASDYIGIDSYAKDATDIASPNITLQNMRFLINNYSLGKPVFMVENGIPANLSLSDKDAQGRTPQEQQRDYFNNLFQEMNFSLDRGGFLNRNLSGYLIWSMLDTASGYGLVSADQTVEKLALQSVTNGFSLIEKQRQYHPSILTDVSNAMNGAQIQVRSGTSYQGLTYLIRNRTGGNSGSMRIKLKEKGSAMITVNGQFHYSSLTASDMHIFDIAQGLQDGFNRIQIYFGADQTPFEQTVEKIMIS